MFGRLIGGKAAVADRPEALADARLRRHAAVGAPDDTRIVIDAVGAIGDLARRGAVGHEAAIAIDHRLARRIGQRRAIARLDPFVADTCGQRDIGRYRQQRVAAHAPALVATIELARILAVPAGASGQADGQDLARPHARADPGGLVEGGIVIIEARLAGADADEAGAFDLRIARQIAGGDRHRPDVCRVAGAGIDRIDLADVVDIADQHARRRTADVGTRARRDAARFQRQAARDLRGDARQTGVDVRIADPVVPGDPPFVAIGQLPVHPRGIGGQIDPGRDGRIGQHIAVVEVGVEHLPQFDIGRRGDAPSLRLGRSGKCTGTQRQPQRDRPHHLPPS